MEMGRIFHTREVLLKEQGSDELALKFVTGKGVAVEAEFLIEGYTRSWIE